MDIGTLVKDFGLPIAMLMAAVIGILNYFTTGKVIPRILYDQAIKERDEQIAKLEEDNKQLRGDLIRAIEASRAALSTVQKVVDRPQ